jgi:hypothetical protein
VLSSSPDLQLLLYNILDIFSRYASQLEQIHVGANDVRDLQTSRTSLSSLSRLYIAIYGSLLLNITSPDLTLLENPEYVAGNVASTLQLVLMKNLPARAKHVKRSQKLRDLSFNSANGHPCRSVVISTTSILIPTT